MSEVDWNNPKVQADAALEVMKLGARAQSMIADFLAKNATENSLANMDPLNISNAFMELSAKMLSDPAKLAETQLNMWQDYMKLWQSTSMRMLGHESETVIEADKGDKRFKSDEWRDNQIFDFIKQSYLLTSKYVSKAVQDTEGLSEKDKTKAEFYTKQFLDAISPTNFVFTNPEVLKATVEEKGQNLIRGLENILEDLERGKGRLSIKMTDMDAFEVGRNIAVTPGDVVFENRMFQLIQYKAQTEEVYEIPILFLPPWINKFYILDLSEKKSLIRWLVEQGFTVYCVSWVNPDGSYRDVSFE
ncbi:MAG: class I poly(R)-hydroxyalkanoic acid synthase, partial [Sphingomonadales bacterium]